MTNFEKWRQGLTPEMFLGGGHHSGEPYTACTLRCSECPADTCPRKDPACIARDAICEENWLAWCNMYSESDMQLVDLPCNIGDTVYWISRFGTGIKQGTVTAIKISKFGFDLEISQNQEDHLTVRREFEKVFLTYEEAAEAAMGRW